TAEIVHAFREAHHSDKLSVRQLGIERAGDVLRGCLELFGEPKFGGPAIVKRGTIALVLDRMLERIGGADGSQTADALDLRGSGAGAEHDAGQCNEGQQSGDEFSLRHSSI